MRHDVQAAHLLDREIAISPRVDDGTAEGAVLVRVFVEWVLPDAVAAAAAHGSRVLPGRAKVNERKADRIDGQET